MYIYMYQGRVQGFWKGGTILGLQAKQRGVQEGVQL